MRRHPATVRAALLVAAALSTAGCFLFTEPEGEGQRVIDASPGAQVTSLQIFAGNGQSQRSGRRLPIALTVQVTDEHGGHANHRIAWSVKSGGGSLSVAASTTDSLGRASTEWTLGPQVGEQRVTASVDAKQVDFVAHALGETTSPGANAGRVDARPARAGR